MKRACLLLVLLAGCLDFEGALDSYCTKTGSRLDRCKMQMTNDAGPLPRVDGGNGDDLEAESRDGGALVWGRRWGDAGRDEDPTAIALHPSGDVLLGGRLGDAGLFITRWTPSGVAAETTVVRGAGELGGLAVGDGGALLVSGTLYGTLELPGGPFDAGRPTGFLARYDADGGLSGWLQLEAPDAGATSALRRIVVAGDRLVALGSFRGELFAGGQSLGARTTEGGFVLVLDAASLGLLAWLVPDDRCTTSFVDDVALSETGTSAHLFGRFAGTDCLTPGLSNPSPRPWSFPVPVTGTGALSPSSFIAWSDEVVAYPVRGAVARNTPVVGYTEGTPGNGVAHSRTEMNDLEVTAFESEVGTLASSPQRAYVSLSYSATDPGMLGRFTGPSLPRRAQLSPVVFPMVPRSSQLPWVRAFIAEDAPAFTRVSLVTADGALVVAGSFSGTVGTEAQVLRASGGGSDLFILKLDTRP